MYELTCRAHAKARGLKPVVAAPGSPDPATVGPDHWILFVHGFNNSEKAANATWGDTAKQLTRCGIDLGAVVLFYWPGDYSRWEVVSAMSYPLTVPIAAETAQLLAAYLQRGAEQRSIPLQLSFVAHSLGSLVVLETIRLLRAAHAKVMVRDVLLMAAAVPEGFCVRGEAYGDSFSLDTNEMALYSLDDTVLKRYFQVGQEIAARFPENRRRAVGRTGGPGAGRNQRWTSAIPMDNFDHGDYWGSPESIAEIAHVVSPNIDPLSCADALNEDDPEAEIIRWLGRPFSL